MQSYKSVAADKTHSKLPKFFMKVTTLLITHLIQLKNSWL